MTVTARFLVSPDEGGEDRYVEVEREYPDNDELLWDQLHADAVAMNESGEARKVLGGLANIYVLSARTS